MLGGLALGFAVLDKTWPAMFAPVFLFLVAGLRGKGLFLMAVAIVPLIFLEIYDLRVGTSLDLVRTRVFEYSGVPGRCGYTLHLGVYAPPNWLPASNQYSRDVYDTVLVAALALVSIIVIPRRDALASCTALIATFYALTPGCGSQYLVWILPFALAGGQSARVAVYSAAAIPALFVYYWGTCGLTCPGFLSDKMQYWPLQWIWPVAVLWVVREIQLAITLVYAPFLGRLLPQVNDDRD